MVNMNPHHRAAHLLKIADLIEQHADELPRRNPE
jgi:acyl-CoA reductase-like NAD-dependent aldehyde dehydrogenase